MSEIERLKAHCDELENEDWNAVACCHHCEFWRRSVPHVHKTGCGLCLREALAGVCVECGKYPADSPSTRCQGCNAYREHTAVY